MMKLKIWHDCKVGEFGKLRKFAKLYSSMDFIHNDITSHIIWGTNVQAPLEKLF